MLRAFAKPGSWILLIVTVAVAMLFLRRSDADRLTDDLETLAESVRLKSRPPSPVWIERLRSNLVGRVGDPLTLDVAPFGEASLSLDTLVAEIAAYASNYAAVEVKLSHIGINFDASRQRATAKGDALVEVVDATNERRGEPRKFAATFERRHDRWLLVHARISAPRIDEPEARP